MLSIILPIKNEKSSADFFINVFKNYIKFKHELIFIYDLEDDDTIPIIRENQKKYSEIYIVKNKLGPGAMNAVVSGIKYAKNNIVMICTVDELFFIHKIEKMINKIIKEDYDFVSATRYQNGGRRFGGSKLGSLLSSLSNYILRILTKFPLSDISTGFKMFRKDLLNNHVFYSRPIGWSFAVEIAVVAYCKNFKMCEVPIISLDRVVGGVSTFTGKKFIWIKEYLRVFIWAIVKIIKHKSK